MTHDEDPDHKHRKHIHILATRLPWIVVIAVLITALITILQVLLR